MARRDRLLLRRARQIRREPTRAEEILWSRLRNRQLGVRFRRQEPYGPFIADFVCLDARVVIEVDGITHDDLGRDVRRDAWFRRTDGSCSGWRTTT